MPENEYSTEVLRILQTLKTKFFFFFFNLQREIEKLKDFTLLYLIF